ncbi:MAG: leucine/isoleucine/valine transporter permease subunit [Smithella sp. PtaU1.Bin162]|nr:MAG: leucine/isoleucine/valine transporter permease subunit [Smithella sp. PtaU1.Bin162]
MSMKIYFQRYWAGIVILIILALLPLFSSEYTKIVAMQIFIFGVFAISYDILLGYTGIASFGHAIFFGTGAYVSALMMIKAGYSFWATLPFVIVICALIGLLIGFLTLRFATIYFTIVTLALGQFCYFLLTNALTYQYTGGDDGLHGIPAILQTKTQMYYLALAFLLAMFFIAKKIVSSPPGKTLVAIRENEFRAKMIGYNVLNYRLIALVISGVMAGLAGSMNAAVLKSVFPSFMGAGTTIDVILMTILGGMGSILGPVIGAALVIICQQYLSSYFEWWLMIFGIIFVLVVLFLPQGLIGIFYRLKDKNNTSEQKLKNENYNRFKNHFLGKCFQLFRRQDS